MKNPIRKYTVGDLYFFKRWYNEEEGRKEAVKKLVRSQQIEIIHGGAVSPDESTCDADDLIDNMIAYRQWIQEEFGIAPPKIAWQLDIFGHSAAHAQLIK